MDSEEDTYENVDSGNESSGDDVDFAMEVEVTGHREKQADADDYPFEVLSTEEIVQHMVDSIKEVNSVVEVIYSLTNPNSNRDSTNSICFILDINNNNANSSQPFSLG